MGPWRAYRPGDDPLALRYMTPEQVADLVERARASTQPHRIATGLRTRARWDRHRAERAIVDAEDDRRKLTDEAVIAIREGRAAGRGLRELAADYRVSMATISRVTRGLSRSSSAGPVLVERIDKRTFGRTAVATT